ncbi:Uncharacterized protein M6B38_219580 [Iris pallida]|uniref:Uncharacterized protein n=1 Tax=Iris pallida TaxID=29817 RepID=A0AAX6DY62_IRIPA|nr:Uncharacterized protein M6B38_219580 [Iris pallida]
MFPCFRSWNCLSISRISDVGKNFLRNSLLKVSQSSCLSWSRGSFRYQMLATSCSWSPTASVLRSSGSRATLKRRSMLSSHSSA